MGIQLQWNSRTKSIMSSRLRAEYLAEPVRYSAADMVFYKNGQLKLTWYELWCPTKNSGSLKNYLCQGPLWLSARWRIFQYRLLATLPKYYQKFFKYNIIVISPLMDLTLYNRCASISMLFLTTSEPINRPRVSLKLLWWSLHKKVHQLGATEITAQHIDQYCLSLVLPWRVCFQLLSHLKHTL